MQGGPHAILPHPASLTLEKQTRPAPSVEPLCFGAVLPDSEPRSVGLPQPEEEVPESKPDKRGTGADKEHDNDVVFEAGGVIAVPIVSGYPPHDEAESCQKTRHQAARGRFDPKPFPAQGYEVGGRACSNCGQYPGVQPQNHRLPRISPAASQRQ